MTDKEIIKALECCGKNHITGSTDACEHCFLQNSAMCVTELIYKALDLINRQQAEIEKHKNNCKNCGAKTRTCIENLQNNITEKQAEIENLKIANEHLATFNVEAQAEIERLQIRLRKERHQFEDVSKMYSGIRAEAIKEFTERLKEKGFPDESLNGEGIVYVADIDNLVKEMTNERIEQHTNSDSRQIEINKNAQSLVKSFAEKLKSQLSFGLEDKIPANVYSFVYVTIENLLKEMVSEDK